MTTTNQIHTSGKIDGNVQRCARCQEVLVDCQPVVDGELHQVREVVPAFFPVGLAVIWGSDGYMVLANPNGAMAKRLYRECGRG